MLSSKSKETLYLTPNNQYYTMVTKMKEKRERDEVFYEDLYRMSG